MEINAKDIWYREFEKCIKCIRDTEPTLSKNVIEHEHKKTVETVKRLCRLSEIAHDEGVLALEGEAYKHRKDWPEELLDGIKYICDAHDATNIEFVFWSRYFVRELKGYEALRYLMNMKSILEIQQRVYPLSMEEYLCSMLPDNIEKTYKAVRWERTLPPIDMQKVNETLQSVSVPEISYAGIKRINNGEYVGLSLSELIEKMKRDQTGWKGTKND